MIKRLLKWLGILLVVILVLILLSLGLVYVLAGTDTGFRRVSQEVTKRVDGLVLGTVDGNLKSGIGTDSLSFENNAVSVNATGLDSDWRFSCFLKRRFCLDSLAIDEVKISTFPTEKSEPASDAPIELPSIALPLDFTAKQILVRKLIFQPPDDAEAITLENINLSARTQDNVVLLENASLHYQTYDAKLSGTIEPYDEYPLDLTLELDAQDLIPDTLPEGEGSQPANVTVELSNTLRNININTQITGSVEATLEGVVQPLDKELPLRLSLTAVQLGWPLTTRSQIKASDTVIEVDGTLSDYTLSVLTQLTGDKVPSTGININGLVNKERLSLPDIDIDTLGGAAKGQATVSWVDTLTWNTQWSIDDINPALQIPELSGNLDGSIQASGMANEGRWTLDLKKALVTGDLQNLPFKLDVVLAKTIDDIWTINKVNLNNDKNQVTARGEVSDTWNLDGTVNLPQLQNLLPGLAGGFDADIQVKGALQKPDIKLTAQSSVIKYNEILVQGISIDAAISKLFDKHSDVTIALGSIQTGDQVIRNTRLVLTGSRKNHQFSLFADGPQSTAIDLKASGSLNDRFDWLGSLDSVDLDIPAHKIKLASPTELAWKNSLRKFSIDAHCWTTEGSNLCLENKVLAEPTGIAKITLDQYPLERLNPFLPAETTLKGKLQLDTEVKWGDDQPGGFSAIVDTQITDGGAQVLDATLERVSFSYDELKINSNINLQQITTNLTLTSKNLGTADVAVELDVADEEKPIKGTIKIEALDVGIARAFLPDFDEISGSLSIIGDLAGQLTDPRFNGEVILDNPIARAEILPLSVTGGRIVTTVKGKRAVIDGKLLGDDGAVAIDGSANWQKPGDWRADVLLTGENLTVLVDPVQDSTINHVIKIRAQPNSIRVTGDVEIPMADIDIGELPQGAATVSSDIVIIEDIELEKAEEQANPPTDLKLQVAVNVTLGDEVNLSAYGLKARLAGDMSVGLKTPNPPQLGGEIEVVDGIYKQYGQNLKANGQILFVGPINQTRLAIDAIREIDSEDRTAGLRIQGTVATPEIVLFTEPADKSQDAILSYIVLGRDINEASDQEANLLATAALALTVKGGRNIVGGIASALGIEDFALETRGNGNDTELVVSGRLNDRLLLRYGRSVFEAQSTLYLRYDLTKKLYLEAAQSTLQRAVDLFYTFSF